MSLKGVVIDLDRERRLLFTADDLDEVEACDGMKGVQWLKKVLFIGLRSEDPNLKESDVGKFIDMSQVEQIGAKVLEALGRRPVGVSEDVTIPLAPSAPTSQG